MKVSLLFFTNYVLPENFKTKFKDYTKNSFSVIHVNCLETSVKAFNKLKVYSQFERISWQPKAF